MFQGDPCPGCGEREIRVLFQSTDRLYTTTSEVFQVVEHVECHLAIEALVSVGLIQVPE